MNTGSASLDRGGEIVFDYNQMFQNFFFAPLNNFQVVLAEHREIMMGEGNEQRPLC